MKKSITNKEQTIDANLIVKNSKSKKKQIIKYAGICFLAATLGAGVGIEVSDAKVDHTKELCPITKFFNYVEDSRYPYLTYGIVHHQIPEMKKDYEKMGASNVVINYKDKIETNWIESIIIDAYKNNDGSVSYSLPTGYELFQDEDGNYKGKKSEELKKIQFNPMLVSVYNDSNNEPRKDILNLENSFPSEFIEAEVVYNKEGEFRVAFAKSLISEGKVYYQKICNSNLDGYAVPEIILNEEFKNIEDYDQNIYYFLEVPEDMQLVVGNQAFQLTNYKEMLVLEEITIVDGKFNYSYYLPNKELSR